MEESEIKKPRHSVLQIYLAIIMTIVALLLAAILSVLIYGSIKLADGIKSVDEKASSLSSKIDSFNKSVEKLNPFQ